MFDAFVGNASFIVAIRQYKIKSISKHYSDVPEAEILALFNEVGLLEISMNLGNVAEMLGLQYGSLVTVELAN